MLILLRALLPGLVSFLFMAMGSGLLNTSTSLRMESEGFSTAVIGLVSSSLYLGTLLGSLCIGRFISKVGYLKALALFSFTLTALVLLQGIWVEPIYWSCLRLFGGMAIAGVWISIESWLLIQSPPALKGTAFSIFLTVNYIALSAGQFLTSISDPTTFSPFWITGLLMLLAFFSLRLGNPTVPSEEKKEPMGVFSLYKQSPLGFLGGITAGVVLSNIHSFLPIYAQHVGLEVSEIGALMGVIIFGGLIFQWPMGKLADLGKRRRLLCFSALMCGITGCLIALLSLSFSSLLLFGFLFGGFAFVLYPLSITYLCEQVPPDQIIAATGCFILSYGIGSITGPLLTPVAISWLGGDGLFYLLALFTFLLAFSARPKKQATEPN